MWKFCLLKLVYATARDEVSRLTRERNWNVWNPLREVVHQYENQANRWFVNSAVASLLCWQNHYRRQDRTLFWGSNKKLDRCLLGWLLVSPNVFFLGQASTSRRHLDTHNTSGKHLTLLSKSTCLVTGSPTVELLPTIYAHRLAGKCFTHVSNLNIVDHIL